MPNATSCAVRCSAEKTKGFKRGTNGPSGLERDLDNVAMHKRYWLHLRAVIVLKTALQSPLLGYGMFIW